MWKQIAAITAMNLRSLPHRFAASCVVVIGVAGVVGVLISMMAMATGLSKTMGDTGDPARAIILKRSTNIEGFSTIEIPWVGMIESAPGIVRDKDGKAAVAAERIVGANLHRKNNGGDAGITLRGTNEAALLVHPEWHLTSGRMFKPGLRELVVGVAAAQEFAGVELGKHVQFGDTDWTVVGTFSSNGDSHESEALTDAKTLMSAFNWGAYSSATVRLNSPDAFDGFKSALLSNSTLEIDVLHEQEYYNQQSKQLAGLLFLVSTVIGSIMAVGAVFTALNTMYSAVATRTTEIATLRAIGFGAWGVVASVLVEALLLSVLGALLGALIAWTLFNGDRINTIGGAIDSQVSFRMLIHPGLVWVGVIWACVIGLIGGLFPAIRAARLPIAVALRPT